MEFCQYGEFEQYSVSHQVTVYRDWLPKFETGLDFIIKSALYTIFWQDWITGVWSQFPVVDDEKGARNLLVSNFGDQSIWQCAEIP